MKGKRLYVGNLGNHTTNEQLEELFSKFGKVVGLKIIIDRGFGFVEMNNPDNSKKAKINLNDTEYFGRRIIVDDAKPKRKFYKNQRKNTQRK